VTLVEARVPTEAENAIRMYRRTPLILARRTPGAPGRPAENDLDPGGALPTLHSV